jgi:hypothetical protein
MNFAEGANLLRDWGRWGMSEPKNESFKRLKILLFLVLLLWVLTLLLTILFLPDWQARASFGDMFGSINALFSGGHSQVSFMRLFYRAEKFNFRERHKNNRRKHSKSKYKGFRSKMNLS